MFLTFMPEKKKKSCFEAHIQCGIDNDLTRLDSASDATLKPLKSEHRRAITTVLLKRSSLTNEDSKIAQILPLNPRLLCNKARFMDKIL